MASRLLCPHRAVAVHLHGRAATSGRRRMLSVAAALRKTGREWDYIDAPGPRQQKKLAAGSESSKAAKPKQPIRAASRDSSAGGGGANGSIPHVPATPANGFSGRRDEGVRNSSASDSSAAQPPASGSPAGMEPISPKMIMRYLDEYVIGQERAKKTLSVAVYNHYNRVRANTLKRQREQLSAAFAAANSGAAASGYPSSAYGGASQSLASSQRTMVDPFDRPLHQSSHGRNGTGSAYPTHQYPFVSRPWNGAFDSSSLFAPEQGGEPPVPPHSPPTQASASASEGNAQKSPSGPTQQQQQQQQQQQPSVSGQSSGDGDILDTLLEKSNVLLLGPTGSGKTLLAKTLAQVLDVPFSVSDATPLTQAGYVGEDVEVVIQRLLQSCDYDVARAEQGIVFIDEIDKIARKPDSFSMSKDVSGEGVQQGLLRMLEGTVVTITDKSGHSSNGGSGSGNGAGSMSPFPPGPPSSGLPPHGLGHLTHGPPPAAAPNGGSILGGPMRRGGPLSGAFGPPGAGGSGIPGGTSHGGGGGGGKGEVYHVDTSNILFILSGAFVGLDRVVMERIAKASIGFGNPVRKIGDTSSPIDLRAMNVAPVSFSDASGTAAFNPLDYTEPSDLIRFGLIPEFIGRLPVVTSVGALDRDALVRVLVEPKNALVRQYEALLALSGAQLHITRAALRAIAQQAIAKQTGARGLRRIMENILLEPMFDCPGTSIRHVVIDSEVAAFSKRPLYFSKIQEAEVEAAVWADDGGSRQPGASAASGGSETDAKQSAAAS